MAMVTTGRGFGQAVCAHFGLSNKKVQQDLRMNTEPNSLLSITLTIALTADDIAGIATQMDKARVNAESIARLDAHNLT